MEMKSMNLVMIPEEELTKLKLTQQEILNQLQKLFSLKSSTVPIRNITAIEFMKAVRIKRTKFDQLVTKTRSKRLRKREKSISLYQKLTDIFLIIDSCDPINFAR